MTRVKNVLSGAGLAASTLLLLGAASPAPEVPLGRDNPFKVLIVDEQGSAPVPGLPGVPPVPLPLVLPMPGAPGDAPVMPPMPGGPRVALTPRMAYVAIAEDAEPGGDGPLAAVRLGGKTHFVRVGDALDGGTVVAITPNRLTLRTARRTIVLPRQGR